jgi:hypothetical protein
MLVDGGKVTLLGQVTRPKIEGVETVDNQIEVLPVSPNDDRVRLAAYRAVFSKAPLQRYQLGAVQPIHIIVKNGNITLEVVVANEGGDQQQVARALDGIEQLELPSLTCHRYKLTDQLMNLGPGTLGPKNRRPLCSAPLSQVVAFGLKIFRSLVQLHSVFNHFQHIVRSSEGDSSPHIGR